MFLIKKIYIVNLNLSAYSYIQIVKKVDNEMNQHTNITIKIVLILNSIDMTQFYSQAIYNTDLVRLDVTILL